MTLRLHRVYLAAGAAAILGMSASPDDVAAQSAPAAFSYPDGTPHSATPWGDPDLRGVWPIMHVFTTPLQRDPEYEFFEYACHEDNTAVRNFIETSRYERGLPVHPGRAE